MAAKHADTRDWAKAKQVNAGGGSRQVLYVRSTWLSQIEWTNMEIGQGQ
jgi:hypothetical protein